uniref:Uncharacterized protein n=1 Tax=Nelumbo nucifera TaxID=4432 RepID=A0A822ZZR0_NELNU|nr:TPA_asm: hypothetical protein HUJ06_017365 [Nelumbo nucifera]
MDVYIPEEYAQRRREEKRKAAEAQKRSNKVPDSDRVGLAAGKVKKELSGQSSLLRRGKEFLVSAGAPFEEVVFSCFSA